MSVFPIEMISVNVSSGDFVVRFTDETTGECIWSENKHVPVGYKTDTWLPYNRKINWIPDNRVKPTLLDDSLFEID